jgi:hypothetical protein
MNAENRLDPGRVEDLERALCYAASMVKDLASGWPVRELSITPAELQAHVTRLLPREARELYGAESQK